MAAEFPAAIDVADEDEANALFETNNFDDTLAALKGFTNLWAITRSDKGSVIIHGNEKIEYPATPVQKVVDTTGAGDAYCAGHPLEECARYGTYCATRVIQQLGARIEPGLLDDFESP